MKYLIALSCGSFAIAMVIFAWTPIVRATSSPTVVSVVIADTANGQSDSFSGGSIDLNAGTTRSIYVNGVVEDLDGKADIVGVSGVFYRSGAPSGNLCIADTTNCYAVSSCSLGDNADANQKTFSCRVDVLNIAESTSSSGQFPAQNWVAYVTVVDGTTSGTNNGTTKEINSILSVNIPGTFNFGTRNLNDQSTAGNNVEMPITQYGNVQTDVEVAMATNFVCSSGFIPRANIQWAITDVGYGNGASHGLTTSAADTNIFVDYGTNGSPAPIKTLYWNIGVPIDGVGGTCSGTVTINAIAH